MDLCIYVKFIYMYGEGDGTPPVATLVGKPDRGAW